MGLRCYEDADQKHRGDQALASELQCTLAPQNQPEGFG